MNETVKTLADVQPGDEVLRIIGLAGAGTRVEVVARVTPARVTIGMMQFDRTTGKEIGARGLGSRIRIGAPEEISSIRAATERKRAEDEQRERQRRELESTPLYKLSSRCSNLDREYWERLGVERLTQIVAWLDEATNRGHE